MIECTGDEPPHQICLYTLLFSLFLYFLYIVDPPLCTPTTCYHTHTHFIGLISLIWWTHDLWFTCFTSILSISNMHPPAVWWIMSPHTTQSGTFYSFALDKPYAHFLVYHSYLTCLYLPFAPEKSHAIYPYEFPPEFKISTYALHHTAFILHHFTSYCTAL